MSGIEKLRKALASICPVYPLVAPFDDEFPDSYIVITPLDDRPQVYAGDEEEHGANQLRASWYCRQGNTGHARQLRQAAKAEGFTVKGGIETFDPSTKHYVVHEEFWIESEE